MNLQPIESPLTPVKSIGAPRWLKDKATQEILRLLSPDYFKRTGAFQTLIVGGAVRNAALGMDVEDIDLATMFKPEEVSEILNAAGIRVIPTGLDHGTVTAVTQGRSFEITTLRKDVETDGRHAVVAFTDNWADDARRRDFTMNTLLMDHEGEIYEPIQGAFSDLEAGRVRFVGEAEQRIQEDYLRILRFFRFYGAYGTGAPDSKALAACRKYADAIKTLSKERITQEVFKIIISNRFVSIIRLMFDNNIMKDLSLSDGQLDLLDHFCSFQSRYGLQALSSRLFVLMECDTENLEKFQKYLLFPKVFLKDFKAYAGGLHLEDLSTPHAVKKSLYYYGRMASAQVLMIELAQDRVMNGFAPQALKLIQNWDIPDCPVNGDDIIKAGIAPGPDLGEKLKALESQWVESDFEFTKSELITKLS